MGSMSQGGRPEKNKVFFDRGALPPAESFFRTNVQRFRRQGRRARGICPFHPRAAHQSFSMELDHGWWNCFSCGASGDLISFVMLQDNVDFLEAARRLGALVESTPTTSTPTTPTWQERHEARRAADQEWRSAYAARVRALLDGMQVYEGARTYGFVHREDALYDAAQEGMDFIAVRFIFAKLGMLELEVGR